MPINTFLLRWRDGWAERVSSTSVSTYGRFEATLGVGALGSLAEVYRVADAQLDLYQAPREEIVTGVHPIGSTDKPYLAFLVGDSITVPTSTGGTVSKRVMSITVTEDEGTGRAILTPTLNDAILSADERVTQAAKKMINGSLRGDAKVAQSRPLRNPSGS